MVVYRHTQLDLLSPVASIYGIPVTCQILYGVLKELPLLAHSLEGVKFDFETCQKIALSQI